MDLSPDLTRYLTWAAVVVFGALLAVVDRRQIRRPVFGLLLLIGVVAGFIIEQVSPFSFGVESHYMEGVLVSAGSALALIGYVFAVFWQIRVAKCRRAPPVVIGFVHDPERHLVRCDNPVAFRG
jgi:hypothetical protein